MKLFMYVDEDEFEAAERALRVGAVAEALAAWVADQPGVSLVTNNPAESGRGGLGIELDVKSKAALKEPLNFLYGLAKQHHLEWVLGTFDDAGEPEPVCYFGHEEGRPDAFEVGNYVGL